MIVAKLSIVLYLERIQTRPLNTSLKTADVHGVTHNTLSPKNYNSKRLTHSESQTPNIHTYTDTHTNRITTYLQHESNSITARQFPKTNTTTTTTTNIKNKKTVI
jgi:hypothetical protein